MAIVATVNLAIFLLLILGARAVEIPKDMGIFTKSFEPNPLTFLFGLMALGLAAAQWFYYKKGRTDAPECRYLNLFTLVWTGFLAAFLLHFLVFARPATSLLYLLYDFKMVFLPRAFLAAKTGIHHHRPQRVLLLSSGDVRRQSRAAVLF